MSISRMIIKSPAQYARAYIFSETDENDLTYFINYQLKVLALAYQELQDYIKRKIAEKTELFDYLKLTGVNERQAQILNDIANNPRKHITFREVQYTFDIVYQTARLDLLALEAMGFLERKHIGQRKLVFFKSERFDQILKRHNVRQDSKQFAFKTGLV